MKLRYLFTSAIAFMILLSGCMKDELASLDGLSAEPSYVSLGLEAGTKKCVVKANAAWTLEKASDASWLTIDPMSGEAGTVEVTFTMEATETPRKTEVMLVSGGKTQIITVGQNGELEMTIISCDEFNAAAEGPSYYVEGFITKVEKYDYGNLWIKDGKGGEMYVYGVLDADGQSQNFKSLGIDVGDKVILYGPRTSYNGSPQMKNATLIEVTIPAVFDLNFRGIRDMYKAANPDKEEEYSTYTKDDWKNLLKADLQDLTLEGGEIKIPYTFKGESFEIEPGVDWIRLKGISHGEAGYVATLTVDPYDVKAAPRKTTLVLKGKTTVNKVEKESNLELPIVQYGNTPDPITISEALTQPEDTWLSVTGIVTGIHKKGLIVTDAAGDAIYGFTNSTESEVGAALGDEVLLTGALGSYNNFYQIETPVVRVLANKKEYKYPNPVVLETPESFAAWMSGTFATKYFEAVGVTDGQYGDITIGSNVVSPYQTSEKIKIGDLKGKKVKVKGYLLQFKTPNIIRVLLTSVEEVKDVVFSESFNDSVGSFTMDNKVLPEGSTYVWKYSTFDNAGYMKASAYISGASKASESWLVSPEIDLASLASAKLSFEHALNNLYSGVATEHVMLMIRKAGSEWAQVAIPVIPEGKSYDYLNSGVIDLTAYVGGKFQFAFKYVSTTGCSPTWQIRKVVVE